MRMFSPARLWLAATAQATRDDRDLTIIYFTDSDTPNIFIVVDRTDQYL